MAVGKVKNPVGKKMREKAQGWPRSKRKNGTFLSLSVLELLCAVDNRKRIVRGRSLGQFSQISGRCESIETVWPDGGANEGHIPATRYRPELSLIGDD